MDKADAETSLRLGAYVQKLRTERKLTLRALATKATVDYSWLSKLERGTYRSPDAKSLWRIARAMDIEVADLYLTAGFGDSHGLPGFAPYLRAKYHLPDEAIAQLEAHLDLLTEKYSQRKGDSNEHHYEPATRPRADPRDADGRGAPDIGGAS